MVDDLKDKNVIAVKLSEEIITSHHSKGLLREVEFGSKFSNLNKSYAAKISSCAFVGFLLV